MSEQQREPLVVALGEKEQAQKTIASIPESHPFEIRYAKVEKIDWESCRKVLDRKEREMVLKNHWGLFVAEEL
jgi:hypothetical protein